MKEFTNIRMEKTLFDWIKSEAKKQKRTFTNYIEVVMDAHKKEIESLNTKKNKK